MEASNDRRVRDSSGGRELRGFPEDVRQRCGCSGPIAVLVFGHPSAAAERLVLSASDGCDTAEANGAQILSAGDDARRTERASRQSRREFQPLEPQQLLQQGEPRGPGRERTRTPGTGADAEKQKQEPREDPTAQRGHTAEH